MVLPGEDIMIHDIDVNAVETHKVKRNGQCRIARCNGGK